LFIFRLTALALWCTGANQSKSTLQRHKANQKPTEANKKSEPGGSPWF
jgi:hypothetical protein